MTTTTTPEIAITDLPSIDADVACEVVVLCRSGHRHNCDDPAVWQVRAHGYRTPLDTSCGSYTLSMCDTHLVELRSTIEDALTSQPEGIACAGCRMPIRQVSDLLRSVVAL